MLISNTDFLFLFFVFKFAFSKRAANSNALVRLVDVAADGVAQIFAFAAVIRTDSNASFSGT